MTARLNLDYSAMIVQAKGVLRKKNALPGRVMGLQDSRGISYKDAVWSVSEIRAVRKDGKKASPVTLRTEEAEILIKALIEAGYWIHSGDRLIPTMKMLT